jgi:hypothetical protein
LAFGNGSLAAHWASLIPDEEGFTINIALSGDSGKSWTKPVTPHRDTTPAEHGFVSMTPAPGGGVVVIWLDSRKLVASNPSDEVSMMYAVISAGGVPGDESVLDPRVCECCQTSATVVPGGILAVYRDRSDTEIRDIAFTKFDGTKWSEPRTVSADTWQIYGCPINGPAVAAAGNHVAVAWFTGANDKPRVNVAISSDGGNTFGKPTQADDGNPVGRVDVVALQNGNVVVSWLERTETGGEIRAREIAGGRRQPSFLVGKTSAGTSSGFPRMELTVDSILFAWTDTEQSRVRTAVLPLSNAR